MTSIGEMSAARMTRPGGVMEGLFTAEGAARGDFRTDFTTSFTPRLRALFLAAGERVSFSSSLSGFDRFE